ncbi:MAG: hypothetical protein IAF38_14835, partial [Bacteroidia bacterium]|nr:hypothetical protein [Bacteroidia bacterium]
IKYLKKKEIFINTLSEALTGTKSFYADSNWVKKYRLDTIHYYKIYRPGKEFYKKYLYTGLNNCQFAPFIFKKESLVPINLMYADDSLIYTDRIAFKGQLKNAVSSENSQWSFKLKPGKHTLRIKNNEDEYIIENIELKPGYKLEFSFDAAKLPEGVTVKKSSGKISETESKEIFKNLFIINYAYGYYQNYFLQDSSILLFQNSSYSLFDHKKPVYYGMSNYNEMSKGKIAFSPGHIYELSSKGVKDSVLKKLPLKFLKGNWGANRPTGNLVTSIEEGFMFMNSRKNFNPDPWSGNYDDYYYHNRNRRQLTNQTEKGSGTLMIDLKDSIESGSLVLYMPGADSVYYEPSFSTSPLFVHNIYPGNYVLNYYSAEGDVIVKKNVRINADTITFLQLENKDVTAIKDVRPTDHNGKEFEVKYKEKGGTISGKLKNFTEKDNEPAMILLYAYNLLIDVARVNEKGEFRFEKVEPGIYHVYIPETQKKESSLIFPVIVNEKISAEIIFKEGADTAKHFTILAQGKLITKINPYRNGIDKLGYVGSESKNLHGEKHPDFKSSFSKNATANYFRILTALQNYQSDGKRPYFYNNFKNWKKNSLTGRQSNSYNYGNYYSRRNYNSRFRKTRMIRAKFGGGREDDYGGDPEFTAFRGNVFQTSTIDIYTRNNGDYMGVIGGVMSPRYNERERGVRMEDLDFFSTESYLDGKWQGQLKQKLPLFDTTISIGLPEPVIRSKFSDNAIWKPNLFTNEKGEVSFKVKYPENITTWKNWAVVMADDLKNGSAESETKSFKTIMATLSVPRFFTEGDSSSSIGKALNYSGTSINASTYFKLNKQFLSQKKETIDKGKTEDLVFKIKEGETDSVELEYGLMTDKGISDGERKNIPVYKQGVELAEGDFF